MHAFAHLPACRWQPASERDRSKDIDALFRFQLACRHAVTRTTTCGEHYETTCATCGELIDED